MKIHIMGLFIAYLTVASDDLLPENCAKLMTLYQSHYYYSATKHLPYISYKPTYFQKADVWEEVD